MNRHRAAPRRAVRIFLVLLAASGAGGGSIAASTADPGRLFYTPAQRAQLEAARARNITQITPGTPESGPPPQRFDGIVVRSDGSTTRWVNGQPQVGTSGVAGLKPGQIRADGRVYEPYQVLRPVSPNVTGADEKEPAP